MPKISPQYPKPDKNAISLAGEFAVLTQLALRCIDANLTLGHTKGVDILASNPASGKMFKLEVKTNYGKNEVNSKMFGRCLEWFMSNKHETIVDPNLFYCFITVQVKDFAMSYYIVPSSIVSRYVAAQHQHWLDVNGDKVVDTPIRIFRLGLEKADNVFESPLAADYKDNWQLLTG